MIDLKLLHIKEVLSIYREKSEIIPSFIKRSVWTLGHELFSLYMVNFTFLGTDKDFLLDQTVVRVLNHLLGHLCALLSNPVLTAALLGQFNQSPYPQYLMPDRPQYPIRFLIAHQPAGNV